MHYVIHQNTVPELILKRADSEKDKMGLTSWRNAPEGKILKNDASIAKNYLDKKELRALNRIVTMYLDYAGKITAKIAKEFAETEFEKYRIVQDRLIKSDFDKLIVQIKKKD